MLSAPHRQHGMPPDGARMRREWFAPPNAARIGGKGYMQRSSIDNAKNKLIVARIEALVHLITDLSDKTGCGANNRLVHWERELETAKITQLCNEFASIRLEDDTQSDPSPECRLIVPFNTPEPQKNANVGESSHRFDDNVLGLDTCPTKDSPDTHFGHQEHEQLTTVPNNSLTNSPLNSSSTASQSSDEPTPSSTTNAMDWELASQPDAKGKRSLFDSAVKDVVSLRGTGAYINSRATQPSRVYTPKSDSGTPGRPGRGVPRLKAHFHNPRTSSSKKSSGEAANES